MKLNHLKNHFLRATCATNLANNRVGVDEPDPKTR